jgi:glycosidase
MIGNRLGCAAAGALLALAISAPPAVAQAGASAEWVAQDEVFYHIFVRSFRDSDGDRIGDLAGIRQGLDYLQDLGVTSLLLTPIQPSPFYHNYFATDFEGIDPDYGDEQSWRALVAAVHERGMRIYLDVEIQYLAEGHPWWRDSEGRPGSRFSRYLIYHGPGNTRPESAVYGLTITPMWDGTSVGLTTVNLREPAVVRYFEGMLSRLADPNGDGRFADGVDGFRIDHMMDDLDGKGIMTNLFADFWAPVFARVRRTNPRIRIIAEQYDWGFGEDFLTRGGADMVFAFPIRGAISSLKRSALADALMQTARRTPAGKGQLVFIENHDMNRYASEVGGDARRVRLGAALGILLKGTPIIYYGQELGMQGRKHEGWTADGTDIPDREAFEWTAKVEGSGAATWYRGPGPWWTERYAQDDDGISVAEQTADPGSLLSFYRRLLALRRARPELRAGDQQLIALADTSVLAVARTAGEDSCLLVANLGDRPVRVSVPLPASLEAAPLIDLIAKRALPAGALIELAPYAVKLLAHAARRHNERSGARPRPA